MRRGRPAQAKATSDVGQWIEAALLVLLLIQIARLLWALVTPVGLFGEWRAREPVVVSADARRALFAGFDPFFRTGAAIGADGAAQQITTLPLKLYGTSVNEASGQGTAIIANESDEQASYAVGDEIAPGVVLKTVAFDYVVIQRGGATETLYIDQSSGDVVGEDGADAPAPDALPAPRPAGALESGALTGALNLAPRTESGKVTGIVVGMQGGNEMAALAGFRPGDIIVQVNGRPVTSAGDINALRGAILPGARLSLMVERGAATVPISLVLPENR
ncbi:MAG: hypothetical protein BGP16_10430 [Sphingobium sp. 66-54]|nr:MAG: hypothetical protein BGP16_10430 [Sphingobium sp. 66-54]